MILVPTNFWDALFCKNYLSTYKCYPYNHSHWLNIRCVGLSVVGYYIKDKSCFHFRHKRLIPKQQRSEFLPWTLRNAWQWHIFCLVCSTSHTNIFVVSSNLLFLLCHTLSIMDLISHNNLEAILFTYTFPVFLKKQLHNWCQTTCYELS